MPLRIRRKKNTQSSQRSQHPSYVPNTGTHWMEQDRERNQTSVTRNFIAIIIMMIVIAIILIMAIISATASGSNSTTSISAADTFAVTQTEQDEMKDSCRNFAKGILVYAYCSDERTALDGKNLALSQMADNSSSYASIESIDKVNSVIAPGNFVAIINEPVLQNPTQAYARNFIYTFDAVAVDSSVTSDTNPNGTFADRGYTFTLTFNTATDNDSGNQAWMITNVIISPK